MRRSLLPALLLAAVLALAGCSGGSPVDPNGVVIEGTAFNPTSVTVAVGATVTWTNKDPFGHTVTADDGSFASDTVDGGTTFTHTFSVAGTFAYHCTIHPTMKATVTVH